MMLMPLMRNTRLVTTSAAASNYNLYTGIGSPAFQGNFIVVLNHSFSSTAAGTPALTIPASFYAGSYLYIDNNSTIQGFNGTTKTGGGGGSTSWNGASYGGTAGSSGGTGASGGTALVSAANTGTIIILDNAGGSIIRGAGTSGGGGGGGAGASGSTVQ